VNWTTLKSLGYAGLIPFVGLALLAAGTSDPAWKSWLVKANALYGTSIVSFLGAIHWGLLMGQHAAGDPDCGCAADQQKTADSTNAHREQTFGLVWGVTPSLMAWAAMISLRPEQACTALALCLLVAWWVDRGIYMRLLPLRDFFKLRTHLTLGAVVGLLISSAA
jgi:hypothetical protein